MPGERPNAVEMRDVVKRYGAFTALGGVNLEVKAGERLALCGPSGSGKSTLLRTLNALESFDAGEIRIGGAPLTRAPASVEAVRRRVGMVFQAFNLFPHLTALENCALALRRVRGLSAPAARDRAMRYLERVRIPEQADKHPAQLSGGQQQRVAIARALALEPEVMLLDEPTSALDPEMVQEVLDVMLDMARDGMTMLLVTHEMAFARAFATRVVFMEAGSILADAEPEAFFAAEPTTRAGAFLRKVLRRD